MSANFENMNETDVREVIVRPVLHGLGYQFDTENNIQTEKTLRYSKAFLGHKKSSDPDLVGRADYVCEIVSVCRWTVEVKSPKVAIDTDVIHQSHTYAAHPEIAAIFFLICNGRRFSLYRTSNLEAPVVEFAFEDAASAVEMLRPYLGPTGLKNKITALLKVDIGKPLAHGYPSEMQVVRGMIEYDQHTSPHPAMRDQLTKLKGMRATIVAGKIYRAADGFIEGWAEQSGPFADWQPLYTTMGLDKLTYRCSDEFVSLDANKPTILQNYIDSVLPAGTSMPPIMHFPVYRLPVSISQKAITEVVGYLDDYILQGTFSVKYEFGVVGTVPPQLRQIADFISSMNTSAVGRFNATLAAC